MGQGSWLRALFLPGGERTMSVYWRRRLIVLAVFALIIFLAWSVIYQLTSPKPSSTTKPVTDSEPVESAEEESDDVVVSKASGVIRPAGGSCGDSVTAIVIPAATSLATGEGTSFDLRVKNTSGLECTVEVGPAVNEVAVYSYGAMVWSTTHCDNRGDNKEVTLAAGEFFSQKYTWDGRGTGPGCTLRDQPLPDGTYQVFGRHGTSNSGVSLLTRGAQTAKPSKPADDDANESDT